MLTLSADADAAMIAADMFDDAMPWRAMSYSYAALRRIC